MDRQAQNLPNLPPNVFIQYTNTPAGTTTDKNYYKIENISTFQPNPVNTINLNQSISLINPQCIISDNNGFQTGVLNNQCTTGNYVSLSTGNWNHSIQQVKNDEQMIYQIMYPIIDNTGATMDGQPVAKQTTVDGNILAPGTTCTVLASTKNIVLPKKELLNSYTIVEKQNQFTNTDMIPVAIVAKAEYIQPQAQNNQQIKPTCEEQDDGKSDKKSKAKKKDVENIVYPCGVCGEEFKSKASLRFHAIHHNPTPKNRFQCIGCCRGFEKEKFKQEHELRCNENYKYTQFECCFCDAPFQTPKSLRTHENKHRPIRKTKRYRNTCVCIECHKAFDAIYTLKVHIQKHHKKLHVKPLEDKPFVCSECGLGFKYERSKIKHESKVHMKHDNATMFLTMDRYIVQNTVQDDSQRQQSQQQNHNNGTNNNTETYILEPAGTKLQQIQDDTDRSEDQYKITDHFMSDVQNNKVQVQQVDRSMCVQLDTGSQFNEGVGNTTYIIDNNSSNSIDSVRIGNHNYVPVIDSSQLYNISVAGTTGQYTIEGVVNPNLGNYIIETPTYIVDNKQQAMYIQHQPMQQQAPPPPPQQEPMEPVKTKKGEKKKKNNKEIEVGPFICVVCNAEFNTSASLRFHSYHHNPKNKRYSCIGCEKAFEKDKEKEEHELQCKINYTNAKLSCIFCDMTFSVPKALRVHENKHRPVKKTKKYKHTCVCIKCNKAFDAIYTLKIHIKKIHGGNPRPEKKKKKKSESEQVGVDVMNHDFDLM